MESGMPVVGAVVGVGVFVGNAVVVGAAVGAVVGALYQFVAHSASVADSEGEVSYCSG